MQSAAHYFAVSDESSDDDGLYLGASSPKTPVGHMDVKGVGKGKTRAEPPSRSRSIAAAKPKAAST